MQRLDVEDREPWCKVLIIFKPRNDIRFILTCKQPTNVNSKKVFSSSCDERVKYFTIFDSLIAQWENLSMNCSNLNKEIDHWSYLCRSIMVENVLPLVWIELRERYWNWRNFPVAQNWNLNTAQNSYKSTPAKFCPKCRSPK